MTKATSLPPAIFFRGPGEAEDGRTREIFASLTRDPDGSLRLQRPARGMRGC